MSKTPAAAPSPALDAIIDRARALSEARGELALHVMALNGEIEALKAEQMPTIRAAIDQAGMAWAQLQAEIAAHPELFKRPRKLGAHGIVFGFEKGKGGVAIADPKRTIELIKKHLPEMAELLIAKKEAPAKDAIAHLTGSELKKIGVELKDTGDVVVIRAADGAVDKLVKALVEAATEPDDGEPA